MAVIKILMPDIDNFMQTFNAQLDVAYTSCSLSQTVANWAKKINPDYIIPVTQRRACTHEGQLYDFDVLMKKQEKRDGIKRKEKSFYTAHLLTNFQVLTGLTGKLHRIATASDRNRELGDSYEKDLKPLELEQKSIENADAIAEFSYATKNPLYNQVIQYALTHLRKNPEDTFEFYIGDDRKDLCVMAAHFPEGADYRIFVSHFNNQSSSEVSSIPRGFLWERFDPSPEEKSIAKTTESKESEPKIPLLDDKFTLQAKQIVNQRIQFATEVECNTEEFMITGKYKDAGHYQKMNVGNFTLEFANWLRIHCIHLPTTLLEQLITHSYISENVISLTFSHQTIGTLEEQLARQFNSVISTQTYSSDDESDTESDTEAAIKTFSVNYDLLNRARFFSFDSSSSESDNDPDEKSSEKLVDVPLDSTQAACSHSPMTTSRS